MQYQILKKNITYEKHHGINQNMCEEKGKLGVQQCDEGMHIEQCGQKEHIHELFIEQIENNGRTKHQ